MFRPGKQRICHYSAHNYVVAIKLSMIYGKTRGSFLASPSNPFLYHYRKDSRMFHASWLVPWVANPEVSPVLPDSMTGTRPPGRTVAQRRPAGRWWSCRGTSSPARPPLWPASWSATCTSRARGRPCSSSATTSSGERWPLSRNRCSSCASGKTWHLPVSVRTTGYQSPLPNKRRCRQFSGWCYVASQPTTEVCVNHGYK